MEAPMEEIQTTLESMDEIQGTLVVMRAMLAETFGQVEDLNARIGRLEERNLAQA